MNCYYYTGSNSATIGKKIQTVVWGAVTAALLVPAIWLANNFFSNGIMDAKYEKSERTASEITKTQNTATIVKVIVDVDSRQLTIMPLMTAGDGRKTLWIDGIRGLAPWARGAVNIADMSALNLEERSGGTCLTITLKDGGSYELQAWGTNSIGQRRLRNLHTQLSRLMPAPEPIVNFDVNGREMRRLAMTSMKPRGGVNSGGPAH